jgi:hypothetical protein
MTGFLGHLKMKRCLFMPVKDDTLDVKGGHQLPVGDMLWSCRCRNQNYSTAWDRWVPVSSITSRNCGTLFGLLAAARNQKYKTPASEKGNRRLLIERVWLENSTRWKWLITKNVTKRFMLLSVSLHACWLLPGPGLEISQHSW